MKAPKPKVSFSEGWIDSVLFKWIWDSDTSDAKKSFSYLLGSLVSGAILPVYYVGAFVDIIRGNVDFELSDECFVATVVYGDQDAPQVQTLRDFRDDVLATSVFGRVFTSFYYSGAGKTAASFIETEFPQAIPVIKKSLDFLVESYQPKQ